MEMTIGDYFILLCEARKVKDAIDYIEFLDIYGADYSDYFINIVNLKCSKSVKSYFFNKMIDLAEINDMEEVIESLIENKIEEKIKMKCISKIFKICSDEKILEFEEEIFSYGTKNQKKEFQIIKIKLEK